VHATAGSINIDITDNGQGIRAELLPHVFDLFTQAERSVDRAQGGLGIGLALVRSLVGLHRGHVEAASDGPGRGSRFTVSLPQSAPPSSHIGRHANGDGSSAGRALHIVVVDDDDNHDAAQTLSVLLESCGHAVTTRHDAASVLQMEPAPPADVYLLDIGLPDMFGYDLARQLRARTASRRPRIYALTGYGQAQDRAASKAAGFDRHFVKPLDAQRLLEALAEDTNDLIAQA
jgi:CheY-like chemotaxis protein